MKDAFEVRGFQANIVVPGVGSVMTGCASATVEGVFEAAIELAHDPRGYSHREVLFIEVEGLCAACGGSGKKMTRMKTRRRRGGPMFPKDCKACEGEGMRPFATARVFNPNPANELVTYEDKGANYAPKEA